MEFIRLTRPDNQYVWLSTAHIVSIGQDATGKTKICLSGTIQYVMESPEEIVKRLTKDQ